VESGTTTELTRLPGLETVEHVAVEPRQAVERGEYGKLMLFSGRSNRDLAERIAEQLGLELGDVELKTFTNGETYCRYNQSVRGADVFIDQ
jgi:ribose-phosphate pyrophosphokinase